MRITRRPLYFSSVPVQFAGRRRWRMAVIAVLGGLLAAGGATIGPGLTRETAPQTAAAVLPLAISARNGLPIDAWEQEFAKRPTALAPVAAAPATPPAPPAPAQAADGERFRVAGTGIGLVLRAGPSTSAARIGLLADGAALTARGAPLLRDGRGWRLVRTGDGDLGWVADAYLQPEGRSRTHR